MSTTSRPFADGDLQELLGWLRRVWAAAGPAVTWHVGDLLWQLHRWPRSLVEPERNVRLWRREGAITGLAFLEPVRGHLDWQRDPSAPASLDEEMLAWGEARHRSLAAGGLSTGAFDGDAARVALLASRGYVPTGEVIRVHGRDLEEPVPRRDPPAGFTIRALEDADVPDRVAAAHEAFRSRMTVESYRTLRRVEGFAPELDLVALAPGGAVAAFAIGWLDGEGGVGLFEPVGTRPAFQGRGLAKALVHEGLGRMRGLGAITAIVGASESNPAALRAYAAAGFRPMCRYAYSRSLP